MFFSERFDFMKDCNTNCETEKNTFSLVPSLLWCRCASWWSSWLTTAKRSWSRSPPRCSEGLPKDPTQPRWKQVTIQPPPTIQFEFLAEHKNLLWQHLTKVHFYIGSIEGIYLILNLKPIKTLDWVKQNENTTFCCMDIWCFIKNKIIN